MILKSGAKFFLFKMTKIWLILSEAVKSLKYFHFDWSLLCKIYNTVKFEEKLTFGLQNDVRNLANFHQNT